MKKWLVQAAVLLFWGSLGMADVPKETMTESEIVEETQWQSESEPESEPETETEPESEPESETESETEPESETESETEKKEIMIEIVHLRTGYGKQGRIYDGTKTVKLRYETTPLPQGLRIDLHGEAEKAEVGTWKVKVWGTIMGDEAGEYQLQLPKEELKIEIKPKVLKVHISPATKTYFTGMEVSNLHFLEREPVKVEGFVSTQDAWVPEILLDENVLTKESPMYEKGKLKTYHNAIVLKEPVSPNPNYIYAVRGGSVCLEKAEVKEEEDFRIEKKEGGNFYLDPWGKRWKREDEELLVQIIEGRGYTHAFLNKQTKNPEQYQVCMEKRDEEGNLLALSAETWVICYSDGQSPKGEVWLNGAKQEGKHDFYTRNKVTIQAANLADEETGVKETGFQIKKGAHYSQWQEGEEVILEEEGYYQVRFEIRDKVGNTRILESIPFVIDRTKPRISFQGVKAGSTGNNQFQLEISGEDDSYEAGSMKVEIWDESGKPVVWESMDKTIPTGEKKMFVSPLKEKAWDHIYTFRASCSDLAGNQNEESLLFTVNRFGSSYVIQIEDQERYYRQSPPVIKIQESNLDYLKESQIMLSYNDTVRKLEANSEYQVQLVGQDTTSKSYVYELPKELFQAEGAYSLILSSKDEAGNVADNRLSKQRLDFVIDYTGPGIAVSGLEAGTCYAEAYRKIIVQAQDYSGVERMELYLDETLIRRGTEEVEVLLTGKNCWQTLKVCAFDKAGNKTEEEIPFLLYPNQKEVILTIETKPETLASSVPEKNPFISQKSIPLPTIKKAEKEIPTVTKAKEEDSVNNPGWILAALLCTGGFLVLALCRKK